MGNNFSDKKFFKYIVWLVRLFTGGVFILSGFVKAIDPWGTIIKVSEYLSYWGVDLWQNLIVAFVFFLCVLEFITGIFLVFGCFRRIWTWIGALIMMFMLPMTLWIAIKNPVADCGCFGDFLTISNWATFFKNILISGGIIFLIKYNTLLPSLINKHFQWLALVVSVLFGISIEWYGYYFQPLIDFRSFPEGKSLICNDDEQEGPQYLFVYQNGDKTVEISSADDIPSEDEGWEFVERKEINNLPETNKEEKKCFEILNTENAEYDSSDAIQEEGTELLILSPNLSKVSLATIWKLNALYDWSKENDIFMASVVAGNSDEIEKWIDMSMAEYPIYIADESQILQIARGNPAIVWLNNGIIVRKTSLRTIDIDELEKINKDELSQVFGLENTIVLKSLVGIYITIFSFILVLSVLPWLKRKMDSGTRISYDSKSDNQNDQNSKSE